MNKVVFLLITTSLLTLVFGGGFLYQKLEEAPSSFKSDVYSLEVLNKTLKSLDNVNHDHNKLIEKLNNLNSSESIDAETLQKLAPNQELF